MSASFSVTTANGEIKEVSNLKECKEPVIAISWIVKDTNSKEEKEDLQKKLLDPSFYQTVTPK